MRNKLLILALAILLLPSMVFAKEISLKEFSYRPDVDESLNMSLGVTETKDGGYVTITIEENYDYDTDEEETVVNLIKFNKKDEIVWKKEVPAVGFFLDLDIDEEDNIYLTGMVYYSNTVEYDSEVLYVAKYDKDGKFIWEYIYDNSDIKYSGYISPFDLEILSDGRIVVVGYGNYGTPCASPSENLGYDETIGCVNINYAFHVTLTKDGKLDKYNLFNYDREDYFYGVTALSDGGYVAVGATTSTDVPGVTNPYIQYEENQVPIIVKFDKDGNVKWIKHYETPSNLADVNSCDEATSGKYFDAVEMCDGSIAVVGTVPHLTTVEALVGSKWEELGTALKDYGVLKSTHTGEFIEYESNAGIVIKYDENGKVLGEYIYDKEYTDAYTDIVVNNDCSLLVSGYEGVYVRRNYSLGSSNLSDEVLGELPEYCIDSTENSLLTWVSADLKENWSKTYSSNGMSVLYNISPVGDKEFAAVGFFSANDMKDFTLGENDYMNTMIVRVSFDYEITQQPTKNGIFLVAEKTENETGYIVASPNEGYKVQSVKVVDSNGNDVIVTKNDDGSYTYDIYDDTWVSVEFVTKSILENPKTGVKSFLLLGIIVLVLGFVGYNLINKKQVFKRM